MDIFYHAMNYTSKGTVDAASGGAFKRKSVEDVTQLIEELANSNYRALFEASRSSRRLRGGVIELNKMSTIEAKLDTIMNRMNNQERGGNFCNEVGVVEGVGQKCYIDKGLAHEVPIRLRKLSLLMGKEATISIQTTTFQPTTHRP